MKNTFSKATELFKSKGAKTALVFALSLILIGGAAAAYSAFGGSSQKKASAPADPDSLSYRLADSGTGSIVLSEDYTTGEILFVNGDKTLSGNGRILASQGCGEYIVVINDGASLTVDGVTLSGEDLVSGGIYVSPLASLSFVSGSVENVTGTGVRVLGTADVSGGAIKRAGGNWIMVDEGAEVSMDGCTLSESGDTGIITAAGSTVSIGSGVSASGSGSYLVYNGGSMSITGGSYSDAGNYFFHNDGKLTVKDCSLEGAKDLGYFENAQGAEADISGCEMKHSRADMIYNLGTLSVSDCELDGCSSSAIESKGSSSKLTVSNCSIDNVGKTALLLKSTTVDAANVKIGKCGACGINSRGSEFTGDGVEIESAGDIGVYNNSVSDSDATVGNLVLKSFSIGTASSYCIRNNGGTMQLTKGTVGKGESYGLYVKDGKVQANGVDFLGTLDPERAVIQVGLSTKPVGELTLTDSTVTGGAKGVNNHGSFTFNSGKIYNNRTTGKGTGSGVFNDGTFVMNGGEITLNTAQYSSGGGLSNSGEGRAIIYGGSITSNFSGKYGGGIYNSGVLEFRGGDVSGNYSCAGGGGVETGGEAYFSGGSIVGNASGNGGGGVYVGSKGSAYFTDTLISQNRSSNGKSGGGISVNGGRCSIFCGTVISYNYSDSNGGGVYNYGYLYFHAGLITGNTAVKNGGGVGNVSYTNNYGITYSGTFISDGGIINYNSAGGYGGGIYNSTLLNLSKCAVSGNSSVKGGGGIETNGTAALNDAVITLNRSDSNGGGLYCGQKAQTAIKNSSISLNWVTGDGKGGGIYNSGNTYVGEGNVITGNCDLKAEGAHTLMGGGIYNNGFINLSSGSDIRDNTGLTGASNICNAEAADFVLNGRQTLDEVYLENGSYLTLDKSVTSDTEVGVYMEGFLPGYTVISADDGSIITDAINNGIIRLEDNASLPEPDRLSLIRSDSSGILFGTEKQHKLLKENGEFEEGTLEELIALAGTEGYTSEITLQSSCTVASPLKPGCPITLKSEGDSTFSVIFTDPDSGLTLTGEDNSLKGVGFRSSCSLKSAAVTVPKDVSATIESCVFSGCISDNNGGGINNAGSLTLKGCSLSRCSSKGEKGGGAIYSNGTLDVSDCSFTGNTADASGGSVYIASDSKVSFANVSAEKGEAGKYGGDIYSGASKCGISGKMDVDSLYLASGRTLTLEDALSNDSSIGVKVSTSRFAAGTEIIGAAEGKESLLPAATGKFVLLNDTAGVSGLELGNDGVLLCGKEAQLLSGGSIVRTGTLNDILKAAAGGNGDSVVLLADAYLGERVSIGSDFTFNGRSHTVTLSNADAGITFTSGKAKVSSVTVKGGSETRTAPLFTVSGSASLSVSSSEFDSIKASGCDSVISARNYSELVLNNARLDGCVSNKGYAVSASGSATLSAKGCRFTNDSVLSVSDKFNISGTTFGTALNMVKYPASDSSAEITPEKYTAGAKIYSWTMTDSKTEEQLKSSFSKLTVKAGGAGSKLKLMLVPTGKYSLLRSELEAELYNGDTKLGEGLLADLLTGTSLQDSYRVRLLTDSVLDKSITVSKNITIDGEGKTINAIFANAGLTIKGNDVKLVNTVISSNTTLSGSAVTVAKDGVLTAEACVFTGVSSASAAVNVAAGGSFKASDTSFKDNSGTANGAGIYNSGTVELTDCTLTGNRAAGQYGGAIYNGGKVSLSGCKLTGNSALNYGGAIYNKGSAELSLVNVSCFGNSSGKTGADIYSRGTLNAEQSVVIDDLFLYGGYYITLTGALNGDSKITAEIQSSSFVGGTPVILPGSAVTEAELQSAAAKITLANNAGKKESEIAVKLGNDGVLYDKAPAELYDGDTRLASGSLADMLTQAQAGNTIKLVKNASLSEAVNAPVSVSIDGNGRTLRLTSSASGIVGGAGAELTLSNISVSANYAPAVAVSSQGKLTLDKASFTNAPITAAAELTGSDVKLVSSPVTLGTSAQLQAEADNSVIYLSGPLAAGSEIKVKTAQYKAGAEVLGGNSADISAAVGTVTLVNNYKVGTTELKTTPKLLLGADGRLYLNPDFKPEAKLIPAGGTEASSEGALSDMLDEAGSGATVKLLDNSLTLEEDLVVPSGKNIILDLNGKTITGTGTAPVITNNGTLTVKNGKITSAAGQTNSLDGGGICNNGILTVGGTAAADTLTITGCSAKRGGGIYNNGTLTSYYTVISGNTATNPETAGGGGIYTAGTANLGNGTSISSNSAVNSVEAKKLNGGGLYVGGGTTTIDGASIDNNTDENTNRDIYAASGATVNIKSGSFGAVYAYAASGKSCTVTVSGGYFGSLKAYTSNENVIVTVSGGYYKTAPSDAFIKENYHKEEIGGDYPYSVVPNPLLLMLSPAEAGEKPEATAEEPQELSRPEEEAVKEPAIQEGPKEVP